MKLVPHIILSVLTVCLATECTKVNYGAPEDMPESVAVSFKFDWQDQEAPGEMYVVMSRIINTVHYGWLVAPDGTVTGQIPDYETPQDDGTGDENTGETGDDEGNTGTGRIRYRQSYRPAKHDSNERGILHHVIQPERHIVLHIRTAGLPL